LGIAKAQTTLRQPQLPTIAIQVPTIVKEIILGDKDDAKGRFEIRMVLSIFSKRFFQSIDGSIR
jgi:hypothetical protein